MFDKVYSAQLTHLETVTQNKVLKVTAHGFNVENRGNTVCRISGLTPLGAGENYIMDSYADVRVYRNEYFVISFDENNLESGVEGINKVVFHVDKINGFPYPV